ncbi:MAG TPA: hypothetical protein VGP94_12155 [Tepidisphaeraceae bacterium]|nr:hypothetical protein [Tepidisphaeraceae bacterium]
MNFCLHLFIKKDMINHMPSEGQSLPAVLRWSPSGRAVVFALSAMSIWCLLSEFYGLCSMRTFVFFVLIPAMILLAAMALIDRAKGDHRLFTAVIVGAIAGLFAAISYDLFRLPWVIGHAQQVGPTWLRLPLFRVFPQFGAMILNQPFTSQQSQNSFSLWAHLVGWIYHFSNGMTFGIMYMALIGDSLKRSWLWAMALAAGLEILMLLTPYTSFFAIRITALFIIVTLTAHLLFGLVLGHFSKWMQRHSLASFQLRLA